MIKEEAFMATFVFECSRCLSVFEVEASFDATDGIAKCPQCGGWFKINPKELSKSFSKEKKAKKRKQFFKKIFKK